MPSGLFSFLVGRTIKILVPFMFPKSEGYVTGTFGRMCFYGPPSFVNECLEGLNQVLPRYDPHLQQTMQSDDTPFFFFLETKFWNAYNTAGVYSISSEIFAFKAHGIGQHIVWRYFQSLRTGVGLVAALKETPAKREANLLQARAAMFAWLKASKYSEAWLECYQ
jgi:hypothetical protein